MSTMAEQIANATSATELATLLASDTFGIYPAKAYLTIDGATDDYTALYNLINTTIDGDDAEIWFPDGTALIGTNITIPSNVKLKFLEGGILKPSSGVVITGSGAKIEAGLTKIFDLSASGSTGVGGTWDVREVYPQWTGALGDGSTDDIDAINCALGMITAGGKVYFPVGEYVISTSIKLLDFQTITGESTVKSIIRYTGASHAIELDGRVSLETVTISKTVSGTLNQTVSGVLVTGSGARTLDIVIRGFGIGLEFKGDARGSAYSNIGLRGIANCYNAIKLHAVNSGYCNENTVNGGRISVDSGFDKTGTLGINIVGYEAFPLNNNKFIGVSVENVLAGALIQGSYNLFLGVRMELESGFSYTYKIQAYGTTDSQANIILGGYDNSEVDFTDASDVATYNIDNYIFTQANDITVPKRLQMHSGGFREAFLEYDVDTDELRYSRGGADKFAIHTSYIDFKNSRTKNRFEEGGTTASRPSPGSYGYCYFDTDLGIPIWFDGSNWVNASGTTV